VKLEDFAEIAAEGGRLERSAAEVFRQTTAAVKAGQAPRAPSEHDPATAPTDPPAPAFGWQQPAPPDAPKLEAENVEPEQAALQLQKYIAVLRRFAGQMNNVSRLTDATADLLEYGAVRAKDHHVNRRR
jgi:hypothetical protein